MKEKHHAYLSLILSIISFALNYGVSFLITPFVSRNLPGTYGYVKIAYDIIGYAQLITIALDSMASRFISVEYNKGNKEKAHQYYCSVMAANLFIAALLIVPMGVVVAKLDLLITIPSEYIFDIKMLFAFSFSTFLLTISFSANSVVTFVLDRLDLSYYVEMIVNIVRAGLYIILFSIFTPHVFFVGFVGLVVALITVGGNQIIKHKILHTFQFKARLIDFKMVWEVVSAGIWNTIQKLGQILLDGLDLIICNVLISTVAMNDLSFAKTMPAIIASLLVKVSSVFMPNYTILYAQGRLDDLKRATKSSMSLLSVIISVPIGIIIALGGDFYKLWIPNENTQIVAILSMLSCIVYVISTPMNAVYNLFTVVNKVKPLAMVMLLSGIISTISVFVLLNYTQAGVYAVVCCSVVIGILRNIGFVAPYAASMLGFHKYTFFPEIAKSIISVVVVLIISYMLKGIIPINGWVSFFGVSMGVAILSLVINVIFLLDKEQKNKLFAKLRRVGK